MLDKVQADRLAKLEAIRELGVDPYGGRYDTAEDIGEVLARFQDDQEDQSADAAGRLVLVRKMGKLVFAHLRDETGQMQIALRRNALDDLTWKLVQLLDLGDLLAVSGPLQRTKTGEVTIWADRLTLLCKSLNPMPEKFHGLTDVEIRSRQRYLDLMTNPESMVVFRKRIEIVEHVRQTLRSRGFAEVETPMMQSIAGGAAARPFITHHNSLDTDLYLRISPELYLKRLLVGGMNKVFEINRNFRNEGIDARHTPEFTMLELYQAYGDYEVMMDITEELVSSAAEEVLGSTKLPFGEIEIDYARPWRRATYAELLLEHAGVEIQDTDALRAKARELGIEESNKDDAVVANDIFEATVEEHLVQPTFVLDYPADLCPLTRRDPDNPDIALRFEAYVAGMELGNAYTELNDPAVQEENFARQLRGETEGETMRVMDEDFVAALRHGMPPAGGLGIGIDRLIMLLTNTRSIRDVILFPLLRPS
jgi:lysyl-tRNA synthetase, class II